MSALSKRIHALLVQRVTNPLGCHCGCHQWDNVLQASSQLKHNHHQRHYTHTHTHTSLIITPRKSQLNGCPPLFSSSNTTQNPECNMISMISLQCFAAGMYMPFFASYYPDHHMQQQQQPLFNGPFLGLPR